LGLGLSTERGLGFQPASSSPTTTAAAAAAAEEAEREAEIAALSQTMLDDLAAGVKVDEVLRSQRRVCECLCVALGAHLHWQLAQHSQRWP
jgi:hypothetical protein